jgi:hypothetical protein
MAVQITITDIYDTRVVHTIITDGVQRFEVDDTQVLVAEITGAEPMTRGYRGAKPFRPDHLRVEYRSESGGAWSVHIADLSGAYIKKDGTASQQRTDMPTWIGDPDTPPWFASFIAENTPQELPHA